MSDAGLLDDVTEIVFKRHNLAFSGQLSAISFGKSFMVHLLLGFRHPYPGSCSL
jgi:hypothetical protein